ncbi:MAG: hypothetical protein M3N28_02580 [Actinomycetota bacterium]|nr:hypothetical protein [Actinomycetota bacterium]
MKRWLGRVAAPADVPVLPVAGAGGRAAAEEVVLLQGVRVVDSPRAANVLLVVGRVTPALLRPLLVMHDQLPAPRATVWWPVEADDDEALRSAIPQVVVSRVGDGPGLRSVFRGLVSGARPSDPAALPDDEPAEWRGVGPYGQGGTGMTGGVPYGRPLAGRAPDPDGLELDQLPLHVGPMFPPFPPGLVLHIQLQGDVIREVAVGDNPFANGGGRSAPGGLDTAVFVEALVVPQPLAMLEVARARHHLRWAAGALRLLGLRGDAVRLLALARSLGLEHRPAIDALARRLSRHRSLSWATGGVGVAAAQQVSGGPVARAAGLAVDARLDDPAYDGIDFSPVVHEGGDARARLCQRLAEAAQALDLAERAGSRLRQPGPPLEGPRGPLVAGEPLPSAMLLALLPSLLVDQEWGDATTTVASLDLDLEEAAVGQRAAVRA